MLHPTTIGQEGGNKCQNDQDDGNDQKIRSGCQKGLWECQEALAQAIQLCNTCRAPKANDKWHSKSGTTTWKAQPTDVPTVVSSWPTCAGSLMHSILKYGVLLAVSLTACEAVYAWTFQDTVFAAKATNLSCTIVKRIVKLLILCIGCCSACALQT